MTKRKKRKLERERLQKQVEWCTEVACDHYINNRAEKGRMWELEAIKAHQKILDLYPLFKNHKKRDRKRVYVAVPVPSHKENAPAGTWPNRDALEITQGHYNMTERTTQYVRI